LSDAAIFHFDKISTTILVHVDDMLVMRPGELAAGLLQKIGDKLKMKVDKPIAEPGDRGRMLGRDISRTNLGFKLSGGEKLIHALALELNVEAGVGREVRTPAVGGEAFGPEEGDLLSEQELSWYRSQVGKIQYTATDRPDVQYVARGLARVMSKATSRHVKIVTRLVKYLVKFPKVEYIFEEQTAIEEVRCFVDTNWGGEYDARSVSGGALLIGGSLVMTWSRTQGSTALSSAESELYAIASGAIETEHATRVLEEILHHREKDYAHGLKRCQRCP